jgi:hypothetical protein
MGQFLSDYCLQEGPCGGREQRAAPPTRKAAEDSRTPRRCREGSHATPAARSWSAAVLCRFDPRSVPAPFQRPASLSRKRDGYKSNQLVAVNIGGIESRGGKLNCLAGFGDLQGVDNAGLNKGQVSGE